MQYLNVPGLRNSGPEHWQTIWENKYPDLFDRIQQDNWGAPDMDPWVNRIQKQLNKQQTESLVLVGHSVGCAAIIHWAKTYGLKIAGAFLVAPSDVDRPDYPSYITGFAPMPLAKLSFPSVLIASCNDHVVSTDRARYFARVWGSQYVEVEKAGHFESRSGYGDWEEGLDLLFSSF